MEYFGGGATSAWCQSHHWYYYTIDESEPTGARTSLVLDSLDNPHISYSPTVQSGSARSGVRYAKYNGQSWQLSVVQKDQGQYTSLALDSEGSPHITYNDLSGDLKHAFYQDGTWKTEIIDNYGTIFRDSSVKIDKNGHIHVSYYLRFQPSGPFALDLVYALFDGTKWQSTVIDTVNDTGKWNSLALDSMERPHISYVSQTFGDLRYAFFDNGSWKKEQIEEVSGSIYQGYFNSIVVDKNDIVHISFLNNTSHTLKYARGNYGAWKIEIVDTVPSVGGSFGSYPEPSYTSVAVDQNSNPFISYYDSKNGDLRLAYKKDGRWTTTIVDSSGHVGGFSSLRINRQGLPVISYHDATNKSLRLAIASLTPPPDSDRDGIFDYIEKLANLDPRDADTDDDGLADGEEDQNHNGVFDPAETDPRNLDTDRDGLQDGMESGRSSGVSAPVGMHGTDMARFVPDRDPSTTTNNRLVDTDSDGLSDGEEDKNADGRVDVVESDPNNPDTDKDGITDGPETRRGLSALDIDSDDDGLADGTEDKNFDGILNDDETNPGLSDTDSDDLADGLELGVTKPLADPDGPGKLLATDPVKFQGNADYLTITNPRRADSDGDKLKDGDEDKNRNGRFEASETDPLKGDTDGDRLPDGNEILARTDPLDLDSDDDGLTDGSEDTNGNGIVDALETSPKLFDSDGDDVGDGVELGTVARIPDPDGNGPLRGTEGTAFVPDSKLSLNSSPLLWDTDNDGLSDGEEDKNFNGAIEASETNFLIADTDADGLSDGDEKSFKSDPLNTRSKAEIVLLFKDNFTSPNLHGWIVTDEGKNEAPSDWLIYNGTLIQASNIWGGTEIAGDPHKPGTYIGANGLTGTSYKVMFKLRSNDDDELGLMFQYSDRNNYYRFSMNAEARYRRITRIVNGQASVIVSQEFSYQPNRDYDVKVLVVDGRIQVYLDGRRIFDTQDNALKKGSIAFYSWKNAGSLFKGLVVTGFGKVVGVHDDEKEPLNTGEVIRHFSLSAAYPNPTSRLSTFVLQAPQPVVGEYKIFNLLGKTIRTAEKVQYTRGWHQLVWDGRDENEKLVTAGIYFMRVFVSQVNNPNQILWSEAQKIVRVP